MHNQQVIKRLEKAETLFYQGDYDAAMRLYALLLQENPQLQEARIGAILSDIGVENDDEAQALFEYYQVLKQEEKSDAEKIISEMIDSLDHAMERISDLLEGAVLSQDDSMNGITYEDFKALVQLRGSFRRAFEDIMFSTRVIITEKEELIDFIQKLLDNGFMEMAMRYIEGAALAYPGEQKIQELVEKIKG